MQGNLVRRTINIFIKGLEWMIGRLRAKRHIFLNIMIL
jgi:hypothetical protein